MRLSPQRHTLAVIRTLIGLTQKEMAVLIECSAPTIQSLELGKLHMSPRLAQNLYAQTRVSLDWLMKDDVSAPPIDAEGRPYTRETFEQTQAMLFAPPADSSDVRRTLFLVRSSFRNALDKLALLHLYAYKHDTVPMSTYKVSSTLSGLLDELVGVDKLTPEELERIKHLRLHAYKAADLTEPVRRFVDETDAVFQKRIDDFEPAPPDGKHPANANELPPRLRKPWPKKKSPATRGP